MSEAPTPWQRGLSAWRKLPVKVRYGLEAFGVRLAVALLLAALVMNVMEVTGHLPSFRESETFPRVAITLVDFSAFKTYPHDLTVDQMVYTVALTLIAAAVFSPWRAPSLLLGLVSSALLIVAFPYTRLSGRFVKSMPLIGGMVPEDFLPDPTDPPILLVFLAAAAMGAVALFAALEGSRALRRAYEEKGVPVAGLRSLGSLQLMAAGAVSLGAVLIAALLGLAFALARGGLRDLALPRVNPVLAFLVMGVCLAVAVVAFAWKPAPTAQSDRPKLELPKFRRG